MDERLDGLQSITLIFQEYKPHKCLNGSFNMRDPILGSAVSHRSFKIIFSAVIPSHPLTSAWQVVIEVIPDLLLLRIIVVLQQYLHLIHHQKYVKRVF